MIDVTCAIIMRENKVLVTQRSEKMRIPLKWEFPGGKVEENETAEDCLIREIQEELSLKIEIFKRLKPSAYDYETFSIRLIPFIVFSKSGQIVLAEHKSYKWLDKSELRALDWAPADIPILEEFLQFSL